MCEARRTRPIWPELLIGLKSSSTGVTLRMSLLASAAAATRGADASVGRRHVGAHGLVHARQPLRQVVSSGQAHPPFRPHEGLVTRGGRKALIR